ncbi:phosphoribosyltransferase [Ruegeria sp. AU67]|uniref:phosphoribosyltransferase n=1 Tax=Ruegeria sp. AU67 TaxID=2108530 RepID=UPI00135CAE21|nr:phosphoribosyltransferase [Ruegeria sp. AU67]
MNRAILHGLREVPEDIDLIVGIPRSGLLAAMLFSLYLNKPVTDLQGLLGGRMLSTGKRPLRGNGTDPIGSARRILVVDDCISQGSEMDKARSKIEQAGLADRVLFLSVYSFPENPHKADIVLEVVPRPMIFQWSCMHSPGVTSFCVDIDGILCADPTEGQDDDGQRYRDFLHNAKPLFLPVHEIGWLVTCRLEKYRKETEDWLERHGVRYQKLVMMDYPTLEAREKDRRHAAFKAETYLQSGKQLFVESNSGLGNHIAEISGKPVLSFTTNALSHPNASQRIDILQQKSRYHIRRIRRAPGKLIKITSSVISGILPSTKQ